MRKFIVPVVCVLVGCAAGVAMPTITAQTYGAPAPGVQRWENYCAFDETLEYIGRMNRAEHRTGYNQALRDLGSQGWELVGTLNDPLTLATANDMSEDSKEVREELLFA